MPTSNSATSPFEIRAATASDAPLILTFIKKLAAYERLEHEVVATEAELRETLFGERRTAEVVLGYYHNQPVAFALFFHNYSTFLGRSGIYLEDLYVEERYRGKGLGKAMLAYLAQVAVERKCGRLEWWVLDWNEPAIQFYKKLGALPMSDWTVFRVTGEALSNLARGETQERA